MSHNPERYPNPQELPMNEKFAIIRRQIGELPDYRQPTVAEVTEVVETKFGNLLPHEQAELIGAFVKSEIDASSVQDRLDEAA